MPIPTWAVGQVLTAADVNTWFVPLAVTKPADTVRTGTTVSNDPDLSLAMAANATYLFTGFLRYQTSILAAWWKLTWTVPASAVMRYLTSTHNDDTGSPITTRSFAGSDTVNVQGQAAFSEGLNLIGTITTAGTAGNLNLQWAFGAGGGNITLQQYSWIELQRVA